MTARGKLGSLLALALGLASAGGCVGGSEPPFTPVAGSDSAYCKTYRAWKAYEIDGGGAFDQTGPSALRTWWNAYLVAEETMLRDAPSEISGAVAVKVGHIRSVQTPLLEKYDFDLKRIQREGSPAEHAAFYGLPPAEVDEAQEAQYAYEDGACGVAPMPPAADVVFVADETSRRFCAALGRFDGELDKVASSKFDPDVLRRLVTGDRFTEALDGLDAAAPAAIAADVEADTAWFRGRWSDVVAEYEYDIREVYLHATPEDLAVFNRSHPDVLEHASRTTAYEDQMCSA